MVHHAITALKPHNVIHLGSVPHTKTRSGLGLPCLIAVLVHEALAVPVAAKVKGNTQHEAWQHIEKVISDAVLHVAPPLLHERLHHFKFKGGEGAGDHARGGFIVLPPFLQVHGGLCLVGFASLGSGLGVHRKGFGGLFTGHGFTVGGRKEGKKEKKSKYVV